MALLAALLGCNAGIPVRSAETTPRGEARVMIDVTFGGYAPVRGSAGGTAFGENGVWKLPPLMQVLVSAFHIIGADVTVSTGLNDACEVGARLSWFRVGAEGRCGIASDGNAMALSVEAGLPWLLGSYPDGRWIVPDPWLRTGVEVSTRSDRELAIAALHLSFGPERYGVALPDALSQPPGRFEGPGAFALMKRRELRLSAVLGAGIAPTETQQLYTVLGIVPYRVLWADDPVVSACPMCRDGTSVSNVRHAYGFTIVGGISP